MQSPDKILIASFYHPPTVRFGGAVRWHAFKKYLPDCGWEPHLLACDEGIAHAAEPGVIRITPRLRRTRLFRLDQLGWIPPLYAAIRAKIAEGYHAIVLSGPPMWYLAIALPIKRVYPRCRLLIDLRDPWLLKNLAGETRGMALERLFEQSLGRYLERRIFESADMVTVVTPGMQENYRRRYPREAAKIKLLRNGYDIEPCSVSYPARGPFTLLYCGSFDSNQNPTCVLQALQGLDSDDMRVVFAGDIAPRWQRLARMLKLEGLVTFTGQLSHAQAIASMNNAHAFLEIHPRIRGRSYHVSGKIYEYLYFRRPVVCVAGPGDCADLLRDYAPRSRVVTDYCPDSIRQAITGLYREWQANGTLLADHNPDIEKLFSRRALTRQLSALVRELPDPA